MRPAYSVVSAHTHTHPTHPLPCRLVTTLQRGLESSTTDPAVVAKCSHWLGVLRGPKLRFAAALAEEVLPLLSEFDATSGWTQTANSGGITAFYKKVWTRDVVGKHVCKLRSS